MCPYWLKKHQIARRYNIHLFMKMQFFLLSAKGLETQVTVLAKEVPTDEDLLI